MKRHKNQVSARSERLAQKPILFSFDIYVRGATEIQRVYRGFLSRKKTLRAPSFAAFRDRLVKLQ